MKLRAFPKALKWDFASFFFAGPTPEGLALFSFPSFLKTDPRRSILALYYPNWLFSSGVRYIVPLECRPCGPRVKTTDPERLRETGDSGKGESRSNLDFWPNIDCVFQSSWKKKQSLKATLGKESASEKYRKRFLHDRTAGMPRTSCPGRNNTIGLLRK